jgi:iron complex transport system substrate-binding protein
VPVIFGRVRLAAVALVVVAAACGDPTPTADREQPAVTEQPAAAGSVPTASGLPATVVDARGRQVTIESTERIIPLDGDLAEIVWALGLGDRVVATDISATYPAAADNSPKIGYQRALTPEPVLALEPTVVLATDIAGPPETLDQLERLGIPVVLVPTPPSADGPGTKIRAVAEALGVAGRGVQLADDVERQMADALTGTPDSTDPVRIAALYLRGENVQLVLGRESGIGWIIDAVGGVNVADELGVVETRVITAVAILEAAPDVLLVTTSGLESVGGLDGLLAIDSLRQTPAGRN